MFRIAAVVVSFVIALFIVQSALAQETVLHIPSVRVESLYTPKCKDIDNDGLEENLYAPSKKVYLSGTQLKEIQSEYHMHPEDFKVNNNFYPNGVIESFTLFSSVCLPVTYDKVWAQPGDDNFNEALYIDFNDEVPGWKANLAGYDVSASALMTNTYMLVDFNPAVGLTTWLGAETVGLMNWGDDIVATVVRIVPGTAASAMSTGMSWAFAIDKLYQVMSNANAEGLPIQSVVFPEGSSLVTFAGASQMGYLRCYSDVLDEAGKYLVPDKRLMFLFDETTSNGCLITGVPQGGIGDVPYKWEAIYDAAMMLTLQKTYEDLDAQELIKAWEEFIEEDPKAAPPIPVQKLDQSCPDLDVAGDYIKRHALMATFAEFNNMKRSMPATEYGKLSNLQTMVDRAMEYYLLLPFDAFYNDLRPRTEARTYLGHFNHELNGADKYGQYWTAEAVCFYNDFAGEWQWYLNRQLGRLRSGLTTTYYTGVQDYINRRPYP